MNAAYYFHNYDWFLPMCDTGAGTVYKDKKDGDTEWTALIVDNQDPMAMPVVVADDEEGNAETAAPVSSLLLKSRA